MCDDVTVQELLSFRAEKVCRRLVRGHGLSRWGGGAHWDFTVGVADRSVDVELNFHFGPGCVIVWWCDFHADDPGFECKASFNYADPGAFRAAFEWCRERFRNSSRRHDVLFNGEINR